MALVAPLRDEIWKIGVAAFTRDVDDVEPVRRAFLAIRRVDWDRVDPCVGARLASSMEDAPIFHSGDAVH